MQRRSELNTQSTMRMSGVTIKKQAVTEAIKFKQDDMVEQTDANIQTNTIHNDLENMERWSEQLTPTEPPVKPAIDF